MCGPMNVGKRRGMSTLAVSEAAGGDCCVVLRPAALPDWLRCETLDQEGRPGSGMS